MANFSYKKSENTVLKAVGMLDVNTMSIEVDGDIKDIRTLLRDFQDKTIEMNIKVKNEEELDEPTKINE